MIPASSKLNTKKSVKRSVKQPVKFISLAVCIQNRLILISRYFYNIASFFTKRLESFTK
jgi:hypothetical protein